MEFAHLTLTDDKSLSRLYAELFLFENHMFSIFFPSMTRELAQLYRASPEKCASVFKETMMTTEAEVGAYVDENENEGGERKEETREKKWSPSR